MHAILLSAAVLLLSMLPARSATGPWLTDFSRARLLAKEEGKVLLLDFTGSDWCAWCIRLRKEVFDQPAFEKDAPGKFVLVELDYPKDTAKLPEATVTQNKELLERYPVTGYPTVLLCDPEGCPFAATGYREGGAAAYLPHLDALIARRKHRDDGLAEAAGLDGVAKARALIAVLDGLELPGAMVRIHYREVLAQIQAADPSDETGFARKQADEVRLARFLEQLGRFRSEGDLDGALEMIERTLADPEVTGGFRQQVQGHRAGSLAYADRDDEAIAVLQAAVAEAPDGEHTKELADFIKVLERKKAGLPLKEPAKTGAE
ncbi:thioredoxin family protein [Luteolibacter marinus]|uniref:thioredoxin family protein n=1 Tax=Luteolibacter marinus TaxID=2776705 RepID=UPI001865BA15|nr:thioredoxin family protein [Luteolibacter marinus]